MLTIIKGGFYSDVKARIYEEIKNISEKGNHSILIVPEQQTVMTEGALSKIIPPTASPVFEVTNFTRLANTVFRTLGGLSGEYCDKARSSLVMWKALTELSPILSLTTSRHEVNAGLVTSLLAAVAEMQSLGIHPSELAMAAEKMTDDKRLSDKLTDLSEVYSLYKKLLSERYSDAGDDAEAMIQKLAENRGFLSDTKIYVEGFTSFTEPQYKLLGLLSARTSVTLILAVSPGREDSFEFTEIKECEERLVRTARKAGAEIKLLKEEGYPTKHDKALAEICADLWTIFAPKDNICLQNPESLRIFEAQTPFEECEFVCADIKRRIMSGASYSDFAIVTRDTEKYSGILDSALNLAGIPAFSSTRRDVADFEAVKFIYSAYSAIRSFSAEDVITYAKCPFSGITREECDEFETYVNKWQISGKRFTDGEVWSMNPLGYTTFRPDGTDEKLVRINKTKEKLMNSLLGLKQKTADARTAEEQTRVLLDFLLSVELDVKLDERAKLLSSLGETDLAEENRALWSVIVDAMDAIYEVLGDSPCNAEAFLAQLKATLSAADVASIPAFSDVLTVGRADMLRLSGKPHIYMLGVNAGEFPAAVSDNSFFSERDKAALSALGLSVSPDLKTKDARELYIFSRVFSYASESITILYSACNTKFKATAPAEVIGRISVLTGRKVTPIKISSLPVSDRIYSPQDAVNRMGDGDQLYPAIREALINSGKESLIRVSEGSVSNSDAALGEETLTALYSKPLALTQTRIDSYVSCPFGHFCKYTVGLSEEERAEFDASNIGSFIHAILEYFFSALSDGNKKASELSEAEIAALTKQAAEKYIGELGEDIKNATVRTKTKIDRLSRAALPVVEGLCEEFSESLFEPKFFELSLTRDDPDSPAPLTYSTDKGDIYIYGVIDRVDTYKKDNNVYVRVVDYKTGQKDFSPNDMAEGNNLQMFLYLKSLIDTEKEKFRELLGVEEGGRLVPAGVIYVKTAVNDMRIDLPDDKLAKETVKANQEREGMVINDRDIISAMKLRYTPLYSEKTPDKIPKSKEKYLYDENGFDSIMNTVRSSVENVADKMRAGRIEAHPKPGKKKSDKIPCEFCEFKPICRSVAKK